MEICYKRFILSLLLFFSTGFGAAFAQTYYSPKELDKQLEQIEKSNSNQVKIHHLANSPGENSVILVEIGTEINKTDKKNPAILIVANPEGISPLASYASVILSNQILKNDKTKNFTWYIVPALNPDALQNYFAKVKWENPRNGLKVNDDRDEATDEDGPDDLNGDGFITQMRVKDPLGIWIPDENDNRLMRKADASKGEKGIYTLYTEGIDNDNDGEYNEDPSGGINTGINFPHLFHSYNPSGGLWPGSAPAVYALMRFVFDHPEIAATFTFGPTNFCLIPPEGGRKGSSDLNNITIPDRFIDRLGAEKGKTYTMEEVMEMAKQIAPPGVELSPSMIAGMLRLGAVVNPMQEDLAWYKELSEQYAAFLKKSAYDIERIDPEKSKDGSVELWSYYHLGIPTFSLNFFTLPKVKEEKKESSGVSLEKFENMTNEEVIALGEEKINALLKENNAPEQFNAQKLIDRLKSGQASPKQIAGMLKNIPKQKKTSEVEPELKALVAFSDKVLDGKAWVNWQSYKHPTLGEVEIGGAVPFTTNTPPAAWADSIVNMQLPWIFTLVDKLPMLKISDYKVKNLGSNIYQLDIWVENPNYLPYPTAMGERNNQPAPVVLILNPEGIEFLSGKSRTPIKSVRGLQSVKNSFMIKVNKGNSIKVNLESKFAGNDSIEIKL